MWAVISGQTRRKANRERFQLPINPRSADMQTDNFSSPLTLQPRRFLSSRRGSEYWARTSLLIFVVNQLKANIVVTRVGMVLRRRQQTSPAEGWGIVVYCMQNTN